MTWVPSRLLRGLRPRPPRIRQQSGAPTGAGRAVAASASSWDAFTVDSAYRLAACNGTGSAEVNLADRRVLASLGLLRRLGNASYIRPEAHLRRGRRAREARRGRRPTSQHEQAGRGEEAAEDWPRLYLYQKEV